MTFSQWFKTLFNPRLRSVLLLGFASGLPLALSGSTLQAWYAISNVDIATIGFLSLVGQPYVFKFLWAPLLDRYSPPLIKNRRKSWIVLSQLALVLVILAMSFQSPEKTPVLLGFLALLLAFSSASQDIAIDAFRTDVLKPSERGLGAALSVGGYRIAMLVSGGIALVFADVIGWQLTLILMAALMAVNIVFVNFYPEPIYQKTPPLTLTLAVIEPFKEFLTRKSLSTTMYFNHSFGVKALWILAFIVIYKLGDAFAGTLTTAFLIRGAHFTLTEIGIAVKTIGLIATLGGVFLGGLILFRKGLYYSLMFFGLFQAFTNLGFVILSSTEKSYFLMSTVIGLENLAGGMGTAAFVAFLMGLCNHKYSATQFALFSALAAVARVYVGPMAGYGVQWLDWTWFFLVTFFMALPGLFLLKYLKNDILEMK